MISIGNYGFLLKLENIIFVLGGLVPLEYFFYVSVVQKLSPPLRAEIPRLSVVFNYGKITLITTQ
jgi:hypothetical protein